MSTSITNSTNRIKIMEIGTLLLSLWSCLSSDYVLVGCILTGVVIRPGSTSIGIRNIVRISIQMGIWWVCLKIKNCWCLAEGLMFLLLTWLRWGLCRLLIRFPLFCQVLIIWSVAWMYTMIKWRIKVLCWLIFIQVIKCYLLFKISKNLHGYMEDSIQIKLSPWLMVIQANPYIKRLCTLGKVYKVGLLYRILHLKINAFTRM